MTYNASAHNVELYVDFIDTTNGVLLGYELMKDDVVYIDHKSNRETWSLRDNFLINVTDLIPYMLYNFSMRVYNTIGYSNYTDVLSIRTDVGYPPQPLAPNAVVNGNEFVVTLNETPGIDVNGPIIKYELIDNFNVIKYIGNFINEIFVRDFDYDINYSFALKAYTSNLMYNVSEWSNEVMLNAGVGSFEEDSGFSIFWLIIIICSSISGFVLLAYIVFKIVKMMRERNKMRRRLNTDSAYSNADANMTPGVGDGANNVNYVNAVFFHKRNRLYGDGADGDADDEDNVCEIIFDGVPRDLKHYYSEIAEEENVVEVDADNEIIVNPSHYSKLQRELKEKIHEELHQIMDDNVFEPYSEPDPAAVPLSENDTYMTVQT